MVGFAVCYGRWGDRVKYGNGRWRSWGFDMWWLCWVRFCGVCREGSRCVSIIWAPKVLWIVKIYVYQMNWTDVGWHFSVYQWWWECCACDLNGEVSFLLGRWAVGKYICVGLRWDNICGKFIIGWYRFFGADMECWWWLCLEGRVWSPDMWWETPSRLDYCCSCGEIVSVCSWLWVGRRWGLCFGMRIYSRLVPDLRKEAFCNEVVVFVIDIMFR